MLRSRVPRPAEERDCPVSYVPSPGGCVTIRKKRHSPQKATGSSTGRATRSIARSGIQENGII
jgi:hypothetical protein